MKYRNSSGCILLQKFQPGLIKAPIGKKESWNKFSKQM